MKRWMFSLLCLAVLAPPMVAQDECIAAVAVVPGVNGPFDNSLMTLSPNPPAINWPVAAFADMWFAYTHPGLQTQTLFDTCTTGTLVDTMLAVYDGAGGCAALIELGSNDDFQCGPFGFNSGVYAPTSTGGLYYVRVSSWGGAPVGTFSLTIASGDPPANDECLSATAVYDGINPSPPLGVDGMTFTHEFATSSAPAWPCAGNANDGDAWFVYQAGLTGMLAVDTCDPAGFTMPGTTFDTVIEVFDGSMGCLSLTSVACNDDSAFCGPRSGTTWAATGGVVYFIRVGRFVDVPPNYPQGNPRGTFYLTIGSAVPPPANDSCAGAIPLAMGANGPFDNTYATDSGIVPSCAIPAPNFGALNHDLWFSYTASCSGPLTFDTGCGVGLHDTVIALYDGSTGCLGIELGCDDDGCGVTGGPSKITVNATPGAMYLLQVGSWPPWGAVGTIPINVTEGGNLILATSNPPPPPPLAHSIQINWSGGPPLGTAALIATTNAGAYPAGWFFGIDPTLAEVGAFVNDPAFNAFPLDACGGFQLGPFFLPAGFPLAFIPFYMVSVATPSGGMTPTLVSNTAIATIM